MSKTMKNKAKVKPTPKRSIRLKSVYDVTRLLAKTINRLIRDEMGEGKAGKVGYLCNIMLSAIQTSDLDDRVRILETRAEKHGSEPGKAD